jgi:hypothetical protein
MWIGCGKNFEEGVFRTKWPGVYLNLRNRNEEEGTENYIMRSNKICALDVILS